MKNSPELIAQAASLLDADPATFTFLRKSQNLVYEFLDRGGAPRILRITEDSHRNREEIFDELEWLSHLHTEGLDVCPPVPLPTGALFRTHDGSEGDYHMAIFAKAGGRSLTSDDLGEDLYFLHGRALGQLHSLSAKRTGQFLTNRKRWDEERYFREDIEAFIPEDVRTAVRDTWRQLRSEFLAIPLAADHVGPMHLDLGYSNFHREEDCLWLYDFDNCALAPYAFDIAAALYGSLFTLLRCEYPGDRAAFAPPRTSQNLAATLPSFQAGYNSAYRWKNEWTDQLPLWFEVCYFRSVVHAFRMQHPVTNPQAKAALDTDIENLLRRRPPICFNSALSRL